MFGTTRGMLVPARKVLLAFTFALALGAPLAASADDGMVDVRTLPRLEGAVEDTARTEPHSLRYGVPTPVAITSAATRKLLAANGWMQYLRPMDEASGSAAVQEGPAGAGRVVHPGPRQARPVGGVLHRHQTERECAVSRRCDRHPVRRSPALSELLHGRAGRGESRFLPQGARRIRLVAPVGGGRRGAIGRTPISTTRSRTARAPISATPIATAATGNRRSCCRCGTATTAGPASISGSRPSRCRRTSQLAREIGRPAGARSYPELRKHRQFRLRSPHRARQQCCRYSRRCSRSIAGSSRRGAGRRRPTALSSLRTKSLLNFSSPDQTATLRLSRKYDLTILNLATQMTQAALAARAKAKKDADDKFMSDADAMVKQMMAADEVRRAAQAANLSDAPLHALADPTTPVPLPETAENVRVQRPRGQTRIRFLLQREGHRDVLPRGPETAGLEGAAFGHQQIQHGGDGVRQGRQGAVVHRDAAGSEGECQRRRVGAGDGRCQARRDQGSGVVRSECRSGGGAPRSRARFRAAGAEAAYDEFDREQQNPGHRYRVSPGAQRQRSRRPQLGAGVLSQRTRQARMEGDGRARRREAGPGPTGVYLSRRAGDAEARPQQWRDQPSTSRRRFRPQPRRPTSCRSPARPG